MSNKKRLYRSVLNQISILISSGEFPIGSRLPTERELAERFEVSRPTIREAIIALEAKGKVESRAGSGVYVRKHRSIIENFTDGVSAFELLEARVLLEGEAAAMAAKMISNEELRELKQALEVIKREGVEDDSASGADRQFHSIIAKATHNQILTRVIALLWDLQENLDHINRAHRSVCANEDREVRIADHINIFDAITYNDANAARNAMRSHFSDLLKSMHDASELQAVEEAKRKIEEIRQRFPISELSS